MLDGLRRTLLFGSRLGTILAVMALGIGIGLGFSAVAHDDPGTTPNEAGDTYLHHACVRTQNGLVSLLDDIGPAGGDNPCPGGWSEAHWPVGSVTGYETLADTVAGSGSVNTLQGAVFCPEGKRPLSGGFTIPDGWAASTSEEAILVGPPTLYGWSVEVHGPALTDPGMQVTVRCAFVTP